MNKKTPRVLLLLLFVVCLCMSGWFLARPAEASSPALASTPSANGRMAFSAAPNGASNYHIYVMNQDATQALSLTETPGDDFSPAWSPDGTKLAFSSTRTGASLIYTMNADGSGEKALTKVPSGFFAGDFFPDWSPDGAKVVFTRGSTICVINADGTQFKVLVGDAQNSLPAWSPDGTKIAFSRSEAGSPNRHIYTINADGTQLTKLTSGDAFDAEPTWSPDGSRLAFNSDRAGTYNSEIYVMDADGSNLSRLTFTLESEGGPAWSPDGSRIAFYATPSSGFGTQVFSMKADGTDRTQLTTDGGTQPDWEALPPNAAGYVQFSAGVYNFNENIGSATITVTRTGSTAGQMTVNYATSDGTALAGQDYTETSGALIFADGETVKTFSIPVLDDAVTEPDENINLTLSKAGAGGAFGRPETAVVNIVDKGTLPVLSVTSASVAEGDTGTKGVAVKVNLSAASGQTVTVKYTAQGMTATSGADFQAATGTLTFAPGQTAKTVTVQVVGDTSDEDDELFMVALSGATNAAVAVSSNPPTVTILDDDLEPTLSVGDLSVTEGTGGSTAVVFTVKLSKASGRTVSAVYGTYPGSALPAEDFQDTNGTLVFAPGQTTKTVTVRVIGDTNFEGQEDFALILGDPVNALLPDPFGWCTILDDDGLPTLSINDVQIVEGNSGQKEAAFTVSLSSETTGQVSFSYAIAAGGTATPNKDFMQVWGAALFGPGGTKRVLTVPIVGDTLAEGNEVFYLEIFDATTNVKLGKSKGACTIVDDDAAPTLQFSRAGYGYGENSGRATIYVQRLGDTTKAVQVSYATSDPAGLNACGPVTGNASSRCDYATSVGTLSFAAGETSKTVYVPLVNDVYAEGSESFTISLSNPQGGGAVLGKTPTAKITITDNETVTAATNPVDLTPFFVRQHYIDFLGREPDAAGFAGWQKVLNDCPTGDKTCDRIEVSSAFFRSAEFQQRAYFIYRFYSTAFNRVPTYGEFMPDMAKVSGFLSDAQLEAARVAFVEEFMKRAEFAGKYDALTTPTAYVDGLLSTVGLPNHTQRESWIKGLTNATTTRAKVLRAISESTEVYTKFYNEAFVVMQYFGYLRRDPDILYKEWIKIMNQDPANYRGMIEGFVNSAEYRSRFGL